MAHTFRSPRTGGGAIQASGSRFIRSRFDGPSASRSSFVTRLHRNPLTSNECARCTVAPDAPASRLPGTSCTGFEYHLGVLYGLLDLRRHGVVNDPDRRELLVDRCRFVGRSPSCLRCRSLSTNCFPSCSLIGTSSVVLHVTSPAFDGNHEEREAPLFFVASSVRRPAVVVTDRGSPRNLLLSAEPCHSQHSALPVADCQQIDDGHIRTSRKQVRSGCHVLGP